MKKKEINLNDYILIPTKELRLRQIAFGRFAVEKRIALYNLWGPGAQSSRPFDYCWNEFTQNDAKEMDVDINSMFRLKFL